MVLIYIISFLIGLSAPQHDFHTSWMNMTYNEKTKAFETTWRTDTEHLEGVLTAFGKQEVHLENSTVDAHYELLSNYIDAHTSLFFNKHKQRLAISVVEVTFAETIVHFKPIKCRRKLKTVSMNNTLLTSLFPNQKNMVQINYLGKMYSMLFEKLKTSEKLVF